MDVKGKINRKKFLKVLGLALPGTFITFSPFLSFLNKGKYCIQPIAEEKYSPYFLRLCQNKKFRTVQDAMRSVKDRKISYELVYEGEKI